MPCKRQIRAKGSVGAKGGANAAAQVGRNVKIHEVTGGVGVQDLKEVARTDPKNCVIPTAPVVVLKRKELVDRELPVKFIHRQGVAVEP